MSKKQIRWVLLPAALAAAAGVWQFHNQAASAPAKVAEAPVPVTTAVAERRDVPVYLEGVGSVQAYQTVSVHPQVDGRLLQANFTEGQQVHAGDLLGQLDPRSYQATLNQAIAKKAEDQALLVNARADVERNAPLVEKQYFSPQAFDALRAKVAQLSAAVQGDDAAIEVARIQLDYTAIRSPIDGRAGMRQIDPGNILHSQPPDGAPSGSSDTLVVVQQLHPIAAIFTLPQEDLPRLVAAAAHGAVEVAVFGRNGGDPLDRGRLEVIDNQVDPTTGTVRLKATFANAQNTLWPGQFVNAKLLAETRQRTVTVPSTAVQRGSQGESVFIAKDDGSVEQRPIVAGTVNGGLTEILQGLADGETVITAGHYRLRPGVKVAATLAAAPEHPASAKPEKRS